MQPIDLKPVDGVRITTIIDNVSDALLADREPATRARKLPRVEARFTEEGGSFDALKAEHGFSALIELERDGKSHTILFDTGVSPTGAVENMRRLELAPSDIEAIVLSHGHYDHTMGLHGIADRLGSAGLPVILHPDAWNKRRIVVEGRDPRMLPTPSKSALIGAGFEIIEERQPSFLFDECLLITGEVDRSTEYELGMRGQEQLRDGRWEPDPLTLDDQAVVFHVRDKGLVVLTGYGHAGIVNIVRHARRITGVNEIYAIMGGLHLPDDAEATVIPDTCTALRAFQPDVLVPAHCTGWRATHELAAAMPDAFIQNSVGTRFDL